MRSATVLLTVLVAVPALFAFACGSEQPATRAACGPIVFDEARTDDGAPEVVNSELVSVPAGGTTQKTISFEGPAGGGVLVRPDSLDGVSGTFDGSRLEEGDYVFAGTLLGVAEKREAVLKLNNSTGSDINMVVATLVTGGDRHLEIATDRHIVGEGDSACVRVRLSAAAPDEDVQLFVGQEASGKPIELEKLADGEWSAIWKPGKPGDYTLIATVGGAKPRRAVSSITGGSGADILPGVTSDRTGRGSPFGTVRLSVSIEVRVAGEHRLLVNLRAQDGTLVWGNATETLDSGMHVVHIDIATSEFFRGDFSGDIEVVDAILLRFDEGEGEIDEDQEPTLGMLRPGSAGAAIRGDGVPTPKPAPTP